MGENLCLFVNCTMRKAAHMKHQTARAKKRMQELTFGTFNVRTAAFKRVNGIEHVDVLLRICAAKACDVIGLQETKETEFRKLWQLDTASTSVVIAAGSKGEKGNMGLDWQ